MSPLPVCLPSEVAREIEAAARAASPREACGVLVGRTGDAAARIIRQEIAENLETESPEGRYRLDPLALLQSDKRALAEGLEVVGIWHSHPEGPAVPSETDLRTAWEGYLYLIVAPGQAAVAEVRAWRLEDGRFVEQPIV